MKSFLKIVAVASLATVAACGGKGDDSAASNVAEAYDNQADQLEAMADNTTNEVQAETLENQADALENTGEARAEAIDDADINASATNMSNAM